APDRRPPHSAHHQPGGRVRAGDPGRLDPPQRVGELVRERQHVADHAPRVGGRDRGGGQLVAAPGTRSPASTVASGSIRAPSSTTAPGPIAAPAPTTAPGPISASAPTRTPAPSTLERMMQSAPVTTPSCSTERSTVESLPTRQWRPRTD